MRFALQRKILFILGLFAILVAAGTRPAPAQAFRCPDVKISAPFGRIDRNKPLRFVAVAGDITDENLSYTWGVSVPATIKKVGEEPDEVDIDLKGFSERKILVSVEVGGLPEGCPKTATYEVDEPPDSPEKTETVTESNEAGELHSDADAPTLSLNCPVTVEEGTPLYFNVNVDGIALDIKPTYNWKVTPASISSGQSTPTIKVETRGQGNQIIRAELSVGGLPHTVSCATMVKAAPYAYKLEEFSSALGIDEKERRLRRFFLRLRAGLKESAYIIAYGRKGAARAEGQLARRYLVEANGIDSARVVVIDGGLRKETAIELWVAQPGAPLPFGRSVID